MQDLAEEKSESSGILKKLKTYWDNLNNSIKAISTLLAAFLIILTQIDKIREIFDRTIPDEILTEILYMDTIDSNKREQIFNKCDKYDLQCLNPILNKCEKLKIENKAQIEAIAWIFKLDVKEGDNKVYDACMLKAKTYINSEMNLLSDNKSAVNGINFYIELFEKFKPDHNEDVIELFNSMQVEINKNTNLDPLAKQVLNNKLEQEIKI